MRVALNVEQLLSESPGGVGRYCRQLATLLTTVTPADRVLAVVARHPPASVAVALRAAGIDAPVAIQRLPRPFLYDGWVRTGWPPVTLGPWSADGADLVHAPSAAVPGRGPRPLVVTVHDAASERFPEAFTPRGRAFHRRGAAAAAARADAVITVSQAAADEIAELTPIRPEQLRVVHHGVEAPTLDPADVARRVAALGLEPGGYLLWVGSREPRKAVGTLVAALAALARGGRQVPTLVLAGYRGWLSDGLIDPADRAELGAGLVELGPVGDEDLWPLYASATAFALPSRHEGFGLPVVEAMAVGTPVVCSDLPVLREVSGGAALLVPVDDVSAWSAALDGLLGDGPALARLAAAGLARAAALRPAQMVAATRAVYREVV